MILGRKKMDKIEELLNAKENNRATPLIVLVPIDTEQHIMYLEKFSKRLKELMELEGFSIRALSLKIKVERRSIQLWLAGKFFPRYDALIKLSIYFGVRIDYLLKLHIKS